MCGVTLLKVYCTMTWSLVLLYCAVMGLTSTVVNALLINESQNMGQLDSNLSPEPCDVP